MTPCSEWVSSQPLQCSYLDCCARARGRRRPTPLTAAPRSNTSADRRPYDTHNCSTKRPNHRNTRSNQRRRENMNAGSRRTTVLATSQSYATFNQRRSGSFMYARWRPALTTVARAPAARSAAQRRPRCPGALLMCYVLNVLATAGYQCLQLAGDWAE